MVNCIRDVFVVNHRLDPHETELRIHVDVKDLTPTTVIKGRLMGPRCVYRSTVEIAYPMVEIERGEHIVLRVVIPEPSWWEPKTPFLYQGPFELWQDGEMCDRREISHGIRWLQLTSKGLRLNGQPFVLRGRVIEAPFKIVADQLRDERINVVLTSFNKLGVEPDLWHETDRGGVFVIESTNIPSHFLRWRQRANGHASVFGWVVNPFFFVDSPFGFNDHGLQQKRNLFGVDLAAGLVPPNASFVLCAESELNLWTDLELPRIVLVEKLPENVPVRSDVIGWIEVL